VPFLLWTGLWFRVDTPLQRWIFPLTRFLYQHADGIVAYGEHVKRYLVSEGVRPERIFIAPHAVDNSFYSRTVSEEEKGVLREKLGIPPDQNVILYLGRLEEIKGLTYLLKAFGSGHLSGALLVIAGNGSQRRALENLTLQMGIRSRVRFAGHVPPEETVAYYALSSIVVLPSVSTAQGKEAWGLVVNEAFNQSVPVVATDTVGAVSGGLLRTRKTAWWCRSAMPARWHGLFRRFGKIPWRASVWGRRPNTRFESGTMRFKPAVSCSPSRRYCLNV